VHEYVCPHCKSGVLRYYDDGPIPDGYEATCEHPSDAARERNVCGTLHRWSALRRTWLAFPPHAPYNGVSLN